jgi:hypothetical protein
MENIKLCGRDFFLPQTTCINIYTTMNLVFEYSLNVEYTITNIITTLQDFFIVCTVLPFLLRYVAFEKRK